MCNMNTAQRVEAALAANDTAAAVALQDAWCERHYGDLSDFELQDWAMNVDRVIIEHSMHCCCDEDEPCVSRERSVLASIDHEVDRRARTGFRLSKDTDHSIERDLAPYGPEWEREQRDRAEGGR